MMLMNLSLFKWAVPDNVFLLLFSEALLPKGMAHESSSPTPALTTLSEMFRSLECNPHRNFRG